MNKDANIQMQKKIDMTSNTVVLSTALSSTIVECGVKCGNDEYGEHKGKVRIRSFTALATLSTWLTLAIAPLAIIPLAIIPLAIAPTSALAETSSTKANKAVNIPITTLNTTHTFSKSHLDSTPVQQHLYKTLRQAGVHLPIRSIEVSQLPSMYQVTFEFDEATGKTPPPLHITADGRYVLQGRLQTNPSPKVSTPPIEPELITRIGMPVSKALRNTMLSNMSLLKNMTPEVSLYYTAIDDVIWGITLKGQPFITDTEASVFTDGEISIIREGQFAGLDTDFEVHKNRYILSQLDDKELITYPAQTTEKAVIYIATDINCPYCRQLHKQTSILNDQGITVKIIGYPVYEASFEQMRQIWCEESEYSRKQALEVGMRGKPIEASCDDSQVKNAPLNNSLHSNQVLASGLAVFATPAIYRNDGMLYKDAFELNKLLNFLGITPPDS